MNTATWVKTVFSGPVYLSMIWTVILENATNFLQNKGKHISATLKCLVCLWSTIRLEGLPKNKDILRQFDCTVIYINSNIKSINDESAAALLSELLGVLSEICIDYKEPKRLSNIISVLFNASVLFKSHSFLLKTANLEITNVLSVMIQKHLIVLYWNLKNLYLVLRVPRKKLKSFPVCSMYIACYEMIRYHLFLTFAKMHSFIALHA